MIIPKHLFEAYKGAKSRDAPTNLKPVGTGPYSFVDFKPGDIVRGELNPDYHEPNRPYFDTIEMKGGGDAVSAARAVIQTGEYDFAWNMQVEDEILKRLEEAPAPRAASRSSPSGNIEHIQLNSTDPWTEVDGERSSIKTKHPLFSDPAVREALKLLVDRIRCRRSHLRPHRHRHRQLHQHPAALRLAQHANGSSTSTRRTRSSRRPAGSAAPTASAPRTARS